MSSFVKKCVHKWNSGTEGLMGPQLCVLLLSSEYDLLQEDYASTDWFCFLGVCFVALGLSVFPMCLCSSFDMSNWVFPHLCLACEEYVHNQWLSISSFFLFYFISMGSALGAWASSLCQSCAFPSCCSWQSCFLISDVEKVCQFARVSLWGKELHRNMGS